MAVLVGTTGAGKSSIAKLLGRVYDPDSGMVSVDGIDLKMFDLESYRRRLGIVPQDAFVFAGTVGTNIAYGRPGASPSELAAAVHDSGVASIIASIPNGLDAEVMEAGRNLTATQRQAIAIARAWIIRPDVLVLDEATSALEPSQQAAVIDAVRRSRRTTLLVAHRLAVASGPDLVLVVDDGRVVQAGHREDLTGDGGAYDRLWSVAVPGS